MTSELSKTSCKFCFSKTYALFKVLFYRFCKKYNKLGQPNKIGLSVYHQDDRITQHLNLKLYLKTETQ